MCNRRAPFDRSFRQSESLGALSALLDQVLKTDAPSSIRPPVDGRHLPAPPVCLAEVIGDPTFSDAILDRLVHSSHRIELAGESLRCARGKQSKTA
jgi:hypothetical protein